MISKLKLILLSCMVLLTAAFITWVYSLSARLESEKQKREAAEAQTAITQKELKQAEAVSREQSQLAENQKQQADFLESMLKEIENAPQSKNYCPIDPAISATIERLWE